MPFSEVYINRGAYANLGQHQRAIDNFSEAIRLNPDCVDAYYNRGIIYLRQGNKDFAVMMRVKLVNSEIVNY
jgi:tetratricopeptide (TPR) repeat protein